MMTKTEIEVLANACRMAGIDANKISPTNPFEKKGGTASILQAAVAEIDPVQAAKWRVAAGGSLSVATLNELQTGDQLSSIAQEDLWNHDPQFVADITKQRQQAESDLLRQMDQKTDEMRRRREGDKAVDAQNAKAAAEKEAREESLRRHQALQQRMDARKQADERMAGRLING